MKKRNLIYIAISIICVFAIFIAVYYQIFKKDNTQVAQNSQNNNVVVIDTQKEDEIDLEKIKEEFDNLFSNKFDDQGYDVSKVKKIKGLEANDIIYNTGDYNYQLEGKYDIKFSVPVFNVDGEMAGQVNKIIQEVFLNKASDIYKNSNEYTIYNFDFTGYLNENIISFVLRATLKEGNKAQRLLIQTANYDISTNKFVTLNDVLLMKGISTKDVNKKIEKYIEEANKQSEAISMVVTSQNVYKRDLNNAMYSTDYVSYFFIGPDGDIYILYPYGNTNYTSEIDIIKI